MRIGAGAAFEQNRARAEPRLECASSEGVVNGAIAQRCASARQIVEAVLMGVDSFSQGGLHSDDRVILILKVL